MSPLSRALREELLTLLRTDPEVRREIVQLLAEAPPDEYLTIGAAAEAAGHSTKSVARWIKAGLPAVGTHKATRIRRRDLMAFLERGGRRTAAGSPEALADLADAKELRR